MSFPSTTHSRTSESKLSEPRATTQTLTQPLPSDDDGSCDILILSGSIGAGHHIVAQTIADALRKSDPTLKVEIADLFVTFKNFIATATKSIYLNALKLSPRMYELLFAETCHRTWPVKLLNQLTNPFMRKKIMRFLEQKKPRMLISTFPIWNLLLGKVWDEYSRLMKRAPFVSVITDSNTIHCAWGLGNADYYIVSNKDSRDALHEQGIPLKKIKPFGYPIAPIFHTKRPRDELLATLGLQPDTFTALVILSQATQGKRIISFIHQLSLHHEQNFQAILVAYGLSDTVMQIIQETQWPFPVHISGWTNELHEYMNAADVVLTKAGGNTIMQCIYAKKPVLVIDVLPGHEEGNALLIQQSGCGMILQHSYEDLIPSLEKIRTHQKNYIQNAARLSKPNALGEITSFLLGLLKSA